MIVPYGDGRSIRLGLVYAIAARYAVRVGLEVEELAGEMACRICEWMARHPDYSPDYLWIAMDAARTLNGARRGIRAVVEVSLETLRTRDGLPLDIADLPPEFHPPPETPKAETKRHRQEWARMTIRERQTRIMESHRALGSSGA